MRSRYISHSPAQARIHLFVNTPVNRFFLRRMFHPTDVDEDAVHAFD